MNNLFRRAIALALTWILPATSVWSIAPLPVAMPRAEAASTAFGEAVAPESAASAALYQDDDDDAVRPILECVVRHSSNSYTAYFGYKNENDHAVTIAVGSKNKFTPNPSGRGQPTTFQKGRTPYYPNAAFSVAFDGDSIDWTLKGPDNQARTVSASRHSQRCEGTPAPSPTPSPTPTPTPAPTPAPGCTVGIFGPKRYDRTSGPQNVYADTFTVPASASAPYTMKVVNGQANGSNRVSSATIQVNGTTVASQSDFNQNVPGFTKGVSLTPSSTVKVTLASSPCSYLTVQFCGSTGDSQPPTIAFTAPAVPNAWTNDPTPAVVVRYSDPGAGASGLDLATLKVLVDDIDRSSLFTKRSDEASTDLPASLALAEGLHTLEAEIKDVAGNRGEATPSSFRLDVTPPTVAVAEPAQNSSHRTASVHVRVTYGDTGSGIDLSRLQVWVNGQDRTAQFAKTATEAQADLDSSSLLSANQVVVHAWDVAGNPKDAFGSFKVDRTPPLLTITQPTSGARLGTSNVEVIVQYSDDQELVLSTFAATLDGLPVSLSQGPEGAMAVFGPLAEGTHTFAAEISDKAGNPSLPASVLFTVDTGVPYIKVVQPLPGSNIASGSPHVLIEYSDPQGVDLLSFKVIIDNADRTADFNVGSDSAQMTLTGLAEGIHTIVASIKDQTGNTNSFPSSFTVDTTPPTATLRNPEHQGFTSAVSPAITVEYDDGPVGSGIDPATVEIWLDGSNITSSFSVGNSSATGTPSAPLAEGFHPVVVKGADRAGNAIEQPAEPLSFTVDTTPPAIEFQAPRDNSFVNDPTPGVRLAYSDLASGVDLDSLHVYLRSGGPGNPEVEVTSYLTIGPNLAEGDLPGPLGEGTHELRAVVLDLAGNRNNAFSHFEVDTVPPTLTVWTPPSGGFVSTRTPTFLIDYADDKSGVNTNLLVFTLKGADGTAVDVTARFVKGPTSATGTLLTEEALSQGQYVFEARVVDKAGNVAAESPTPFGVDSLPPQVAIETPPAGAYLGSSSVPVKVVFGDASDPAAPDTASGVALGSVKISIDGVDMTSSFAISPGEAIGTIVGLADGKRMIQADVVDFASNPNNATSFFHVDTAPPVVTPDIAPVIYVSGIDANGNLTITGKVTDLDPGTTVQCHLRGNSYTATIQNGEFSCQVPLQEGGNNVTVTATDSNGHPSPPSNHAVNLDTVPPVVVFQEPDADIVTAATSLLVRVHVTDSSPVTVTVNGQAAVGEGADVYAATVAIGEGPVVTLVAEANDAAGNHGSAPSRSVTVDRVAPVVTITSPAPGAYVTGSVVTVTGEVTDKTPVAVQVNGVPADVQLAGTDKSTFSATVPLVDGTFPVTAVAHDAAGNPGSDQRLLNADSAPPVITITAPQPEPFVTNATSVTVVGSLTDATTSTVSVNGFSVPCTGSGSVPFTCTFSAPVALAAEGAPPITVTAQDAAGNASPPRPVDVRVDRTAPTLTIDTPVDGASVLALPVIVGGTASDTSKLSVTVNGIPATLIGQSWQVSLNNLAEGVSRPIAVVATDAAGNPTTKGITVKVDLAPPTLTVDSPVSGVPTAATSVTFTGTAADATGVTVRVKGTGFETTLPPSLVAQSFTLGPVPLPNEGVNPFIVEAIDGAGRPPVDVPVEVPRDTTDPVLDVQTPQSISISRPGQATGSATDASLDRIVVSISCASANGGPAPCTPTSQTFETASFSVALTVPEAAAIGDTLTVTIQAFDEVGHSSTVTRIVKVSSDGALVGQALNDTTGLPLAGASVSLISGAAGAASATTDERGRYSLSTSSLQAVLRVEKDGFTTVDRQTPVAAGTGTLPVDARLTPLDTAKTSDGSAPLVAGGWSVTLPAGSYRLTPLSGQGLPNLLPLGFTPVAALDVRVVAGSVSSAPATVSGLPNVAMHLARYNTDSHDWRLAASLTPVSGVLTTNLDEPGAYALVVPDTLDPPITVPAVGDPLEGVPMIALPVSATATGIVEPAIIPPSGEKAKASLSVQSPLALPSGTVLSTDVTETYNLTSGDTASEEKRTQDIVAYAAGCTTGVLCATFPVTPTRTYDTATLVSGRVLLDILAGREAVRGAVGGSEAVTLDADGARLSLAQGALSEDSAIVLEKHLLSAFLPTTGGLTALEEVVIDFGGKSLLVPAELSVASPSVSAGDTLVVARVERVNGIPRIQVVALAHFVGGRVVTQPYPGLPGVAREGRYVFYRVAAPIGFIAGSTSSSGGPVKAVVETNSLPFISVGSPDGSYIVAAAPGNVSVTARVPGTNQIKTATVAVLGPDAANLPQTTSLNLLLEGSIATATVNPTDGTLGVSRTVAIEIASPTPLKPEEVVVENFSLKKLGATPAENLGIAVPFRLVPSSNGKLVSVIPQSALDYSAYYKFEASGLVDTVGALVVVPTTTFRTKDFVAPFYDAKRLVFSMPNADGVVTVTAPGCHPPEQGCFYPGTTILIINSSNGVVLSLTAGNSGEINSSMPATIDDRMFVTITDPFGNQTTFERSQYTNVLTKETAVGAGGGIVEGPGGVELRIPEGALDKALVFKIEGFDAEHLPYPAAQQPGSADSPTGPAYFGSGIKIQASGGPHVLKKDVKLAFPVPTFETAPANERPADPTKAFFYVYKRIEGPCPNGAGTCPDRQIFFDSVDWAKIEGEGANRKVVTQSPPFTGYRDGHSSWDPAAGFGFGGGVAGVGASIAMMMWTFNGLLPGQATRGVVTGRVIRPQYDELGQLEYVGVPGIKVERDDARDPMATTATTQSDGRFTFFDDHFASGPFDVRATFNGQTYKATAYAVQGTDTKLASDPGLARLHALGFFKNLAFANIALPLGEAPAPLPQIRIALVKEVNGERQDAGSVVIAGTPITVGFRAQNGELTEARINGQSYGIKVDDLLALNANNPLAFDRILQEPYTPALPGSYTIQATALPAFGAPVSSTLTFRAIAAGGSTTTSVSGRPGVISVTPKLGARGVAVGTFPQLVFSEPVTNLSVQTVKLFDAQNQAQSIKLLGVGVDDQGSVVVFDEQTLPLLAGSKVTSLTIQPRTGLAYSSAYRIEVSDQVVDLDTDPGPQPLQPFVSTFSTFGPEPVGGSEDQPEKPRAAGLVVLGDRGYLLETEYSGGTGSAFQSGQIRTYRLEDPALPEEMPPPVRFIYPPRDIAGEVRQLEENGQPITRKTLAVVTQPRTYFETQGEIVFYSELKSSPSNLFLYDVSDDGTPTWTGAANLGNNILDSIPNRVQVKDGLAFVATNKGLLVADLETAKIGFPPDGSAPSGLALNDINKGLFTGGLNNGAVVNIPVGPTWDQATQTGDPTELARVSMNDLKVVDLIVEGAGLRVVMATGIRKNAGLVIATPTSPTLVWRGALEKAGESLDWGQAIAYARIDGKDLALVGGTGTSTQGSASLVGVVDLARLAASPKAEPQVLAFVRIGHSIGDLLVAGNTLIVSAGSGTLGTDGKPGLASLIDLTAPNQPIVVGTLNGVASRLALGPDGKMLFSTERSFIKGVGTNQSADMGGIRTAAFDYLTLIKRAPAVIVAEDGKSVEPQPISYRAFFPREDVATSEVEIVDRGMVVQTLPATLNEDGEGEVSLPAGTSHSPLKARLIVNRNQPAAQRPVAIERLLGAAAFRVEPSGVAEIPLEADADPVVITAVNDALQERLAEAVRDGTNPALAPLQWVVSGSSGATVEPAAVPLPASGVYSAGFVPSTAAGALHRVELRLGSTVLGRSAPIRVVPGSAAQAQIEWSANEQLPADGKSVKHVRIFDIRDRFGNVVPNGRTMTWEALAPLAGTPGDGQNALLPGTFRNTTTVIQNGETANEYTAGMEPGVVHLAASADDLLTKHFLIRHAALTLNMTAGPGPDPERQRLLALTVNSTAGAPPDGTPIGWGVTAGILDAQRTLIATQAPAVFTWPLDPRTEVIGNPYAFATVGRSRASVDLGLGNALPATPETFLRLLGRMLLGDASGGSHHLPGSDGGPGLTVPTEITVRAEGGNPGEQVHVTLDSYRKPVYLPVSHYSFDSTTEGTGGLTAEDLFGVAPADVGDGVTIDTTEFAEGGGSLRFSISGAPESRGVRVPASHAFAPSGNFGISGHLRLESAADQTIISKAGSYQVAVVDVDGQARLEFSIMNGGSRRRVLSAGPLTLGTWYHFAGRLEANRLQLLIDEAGTVKVGDVATAPDSTSAPLVIGPAFEGNLDEVAFFDLQRTPNATFADGSVSTTATLNDQGQADLTIRSTGVFQGVPLGGLSRYGTNWVRIYEPPLLPDDWVHSWLNVDQALRQRYGTYVTGLLTECGAGIADGESGDAIGAACDLLLGIGSLFTPAGPAVNLAQSSRDVVVSTKNFIDGKHRTGNAIKASISVLGVMAVVLNPVGRVAKLSKRAVQVIEGAGTAERVVLKEALEAVARTAGGEGEAVSKLLDVLGDETGRVATRSKNTLRTLLVTAGADDAGRMAVSLERLGTVYGYEGVLDLLDNALLRIASNPALRSTLNDRLALRVVSTLDELARGGAATAPRLTGDVVEGVAVLIARGMQGGWLRNRVLRAWADIGALGPAKQAEAFEQVMKWVAEGERVNPPGWMAFLAKGIGTLSPNSTKGAYAVLDYLSTNLKWKNIVELERGVGRCIFRPWLGRCTYQRYVDVVVREAVPNGTSRELFKEIKNLKERARFSFGSEVLFDIGKTLEAAMASGRLNLAELALGLEKYEYVLRGSPEEMATVIAGLQAKIREVLRAGGPAAAELADRVKITPLSQQLPF